MRGEHARGGGGGDEDQRRAAVDDSMRFNKGYWWEPYECTYRAYSPTEMRQCLTRSRMNVLGFGGDSLGREPMADLSQVCDLRIPPQTSPYLLTAPPQTRQRLTADLSQLPLRDDPIDLRMTHNEPTVLMTPMTPMTLIDWS